MDGEGMKDELDEIVLEIMRWQRDDNGLPRFEHYREKGKQAINAYILGEVELLLGDDEPKPEWGALWVEIRNRFRQELRNKANKKWGK